MLGSQDEPFEDAGSLLAFLEEDDPEAYVFRGQTRAYEGPMVPSGFRDRLIVFDAPIGASEWAGVSVPFSVQISKALDKYFRSNTVFCALEDVHDGGTSTWDMSESAYQEGFREFFNHPHDHQLKQMRDSLAGNVVGPISTLLGQRLSGLLCQQYGLTSLALDASGDPAVAMFYANHEAPYYSLVSRSPHLGVIYRWQRQHAITARDIVLQLEGSGFQSVVASFRSFVQNSADLRTGADKLVRHTPDPGQRARLAERVGYSSPQYVHDISETRSWEKRQMWIASAGKRRNLEALRFPSGALSSSRMGRQQAAILEPNTEVVEVAVEGQDDSELAVMVGDLVKTHNGEAFYFHHDSTITTPDGINKFTLWPSLRPCPDWVPELGLELKHNDIEFEDVYLELMLRFFSTVSPCDIMVVDMPEPASEDNFSLLGPTGGIIDLGYLLHPRDAALIAEGLASHDSLMPVPTLRHLSEELLQPFGEALADSVASCRRMVSGKRKR